MNRGDLMEQPSINEATLKLVVIEIKLAVNRKLYESKAITEEMYSRAKEMILKGT